MNASGASPTARDIAQHLIAYEAIGKSRADKDHTAACDVCEKLRKPLTTLTGAEGFRVILVRALTLAKRKSPVLEQVQVNEDGTLAGLRCSSTDPGELLLIVELLGLLMTFIGDALTMRLLHEIWPDLLNADLDTAGKEVA